jgi:hypothetical protein
MIHSISPFASRYPLLIFRILGLGPRLCSLPPYPEIGIFFFNENLRIEGREIREETFQDRKAGSSRDEMQK